MASSLMKDNDVEVILSINNMAESLLESKDLDSVEDSYQTQQSSK